jgi:hypothetical protein
MYVCVWRIRPRSAHQVGLPDVPINRDCPDYGTEVPCPERMSRGRLFVPIFHCQRTQVVCSVILNYF